MDQKIKNFETKTSGPVPLFVIAFILNVAVVCFLFFGDQLPFPTAYGVKNVISSIFLAFLCFGILEGLKALTEKRTNTDRLSRLVSVFVTGFVLLQYCFINQYEKIGLKTGERITQNKWDALYFSIITWTTTGYGDVSPIRASRWFACSEALVGTLYNGLVLAIVVYQLNQMANFRQR
jgi:Ion channel